MLTWSSFYPGRSLPKDPLEYFRDFSLNDLVQLLIWVKNSLELSNKYPDFIEALTRRMEPTKRNQIRYQLQQSRVSHPIVVDKILVEFFRSHVLKRSDRDIEEIGFEDRLFDLLLFFNDLHYETHYLPLDAATPEAMWSLSLAQASTGLDNVDYARTANIKHLIFLKFLKLHFGEHYKAIEDSFKQKTGLSGFYDLIFTLSRFYLTTETGEASQLVLPNMPYEHCLILEQLSLVVDEANLPDPKFNIGKLAGLPYYKSNDRVYVLSRKNFAFALEKSWPYFLYQNSDLRKFLSGQGKFNDFQAILGKSYVEDYFLDTLLSRLHKPGFRWLRPKEVYMPDGCYVINESTVILLEFKSSSLHFNVIAEQNLESLKKFLKENFASGKKGAPQLVKAINHLSTNSSSAYGIKTHVNRITVYPVIIYTDINICMLGVNDYVDHYFQDILGDGKESFKKIMPLCMIHADFFTENLSLLERDRSLLKDALDHYLRYRRKKMATYSKTGKPSDYLTGQYQFDRYVQGYKQLYLMPQIDIFKNLTKVFGLK